MKIEKISDTQIRCTLNRGDLISRELKISELAYGTEKAKLLFHDMIEQASNEFGFEADDIPLMIEAIPMSADCIVLIITKVDDPEELDSKLADFAPAAGAEDGFDYEAGDVQGIMGLEELDDVPSDYGDGAEQRTTQLPGGGFIPMSETIAGKAREAARSELEEATRIYSFDSWRKVSEAAAGTGTRFDGTSRLYRSPDGLYYLALTGILDDNGDMFRICNFLSEFGSKLKTNYATISYLEEHCSVVIGNDALKILTEY
ncbi:MAG: adaptor protein MecA [Butyrivibrio sp.]|nr:adaptor protein MecA [Butyrivibrio sp.]